MPASPRCGSAWHDEHALEAPLNTTAGAMRSGFSRAPVVRAPAPVATIPPAPGAVAPAIGGFVDGDASEAMVEALG